MGDLPESWTVFRTSLFSIREVSMSFICIASWSDANGISVHAPGSGFSDRIRACMEGESVPFCAIKIFSKGIKAVWRVRVRWLGVKTALVSSWAVFG